MANLPESPTYDAGVYQLETTDAVVGGATGKSNAAAINLANRTAYLKQRVDALEADMAGIVRYYGTGVALPVADVGPIWHADYNSIMTWQVFSANGAAYTGYASVLVGSLFPDPQPTPRTGYIKSGANNLGKTAYAALRGWAMHNGIMVAEGAWAAGAIAVKDNADGTTFTVYDVRAEFPRFWDDGRGVDIGRAFGSWQNATGIGSWVGALNTPNRMQAAAAYDSDKQEAFANGNYSPATQVIGAAADYINRVRPRNTAFLASVKF